MDCDSRKEQLLLYALGTLEGPEQEELRAHLQTGCPCCEGGLIEAKALLALLPLGLPRPIVPPQARARLFERIEDSRSSAVRSNTDNPMRISPSTVRRPILWPFLVGGAVAAGITALVFSNILSTERATLQAARAQLNAKQNELQSVQEHLTGTTRLNQLISAPALKVAELKPMPVQPTATARLFWDPQTRTIHLYAADLKMLPPGRAYELWLINSKKEAHPAGTFTVNADGTGSIDMTMPDDPGSVIASAVSEEQWNGGRGVTQPTLSAVQMQGTVQ